VLLARAGAFVVQADGALQLFGCLAFGVPDVSERTASHAMVGGQ
jgi:hypothetical protein